jgi:hypothetical protein
MKKLFLFLLILLLIATTARADIVTITVTDLIASGKTGQVYTRRIVDELWDGEGSSSFSSGMDSEEYKLSYVAVNGFPVEKGRTVILNHADFIGVSSISIDFMWKKAATAPTDTPIPIQEEPAETDQPEEPPEEPTDPPVTDPPVTDPSVTDQPATDPALTDPPVTAPPIAEPPVIDPPSTETHIEAPSMPPVTEPPVFIPAETIPPVIDDLIIEEIIETPAPIKKPVNAKTQKKTKVTNYTIQFFTKDMVEVGFPIHTSIVTNGKVYFWVDDLGIFVSVKME